MNSVYQSIPVPPNFFVGDYFYIAPDLLRSFLSNMIGYGFNGYYNFDEIDVEKTIRMHSGDCRLWNKDGYVVLSSKSVDCFVMKVDVDLTYTDIFDWLRNHLPDLHKQFRYF